MEQLSQLVGSNVMRHSVLSLHAYKRNGCIAAKKMISHTKLGQCAKIDNDDQIILIAVEFQLMNRHIKIREIDSICTTRFVDNQISSKSIVHVEIITRATD